MNMTSIPSKESDKNAFLTEYSKKFQMLESEIKILNFVKNNLLFLNTENNSISDSLQRIKLNCETQKLYLLKNLYSVNVSRDKQKIVLRKKLEEFLIRRKKLEENYRKLPLFLELEELVNLNADLIERCNKMNCLFESTKEEYEKFFEILLNTFKKKVCEFCEVFFETKAKLFYFE